MLPIQKNKDIMQQISRIIRRMDHLAQVKDKLFQLAKKTNTLYSATSHRISKQMTQFQQKILRKVLYSTDKSNGIVNVGKIYRQFANQLQKTSKIGVLKVDQIKQDRIATQSQRLRRSCQLFLQQFRQYMTTQQQYNKRYSHYSVSCNDLDQIILQYRSYQNPLSFYNQTMTNQYQSQLQKQYHLSSNKQATLMTQIQVIDQKRDWISGKVKQINQNYVILLHIYLGIIETLLTHIVDPKKDDVEKMSLNLRSSENGSIDPKVNELERLTNLYNQEEAHPQDNILQEYSELFKKSFSPSDLNSDYKFFHDRCQNVVKKKTQTSHEIYTMQLMLVEEFERQRESHGLFEKQARSLQKEVFTNNGIESYKKRFRKYFGSNLSEITELAIAVIERPKRSLGKIHKHMDDNINKIRQVLQSKKDSLAMFERRTNMILEDHLKLKQKTYSRGEVDGDELQHFKNSVKSSLDQLKKVFIELEKGQSEADGRFFSIIKAHNRIILDESPCRKIPSLLQKQKTRVNILRGLNVDSQIVLILKEDSRYEMLLNECPKPTLYANFQSKIQKKEYEQTRRLLQLKQVRQKNMLKPRKGCCGITSEPVKHNILSSHNCKLVTNDDKCKGELFISAQGLIFQESTWFSDGLRLVIPQSDLNRFDTKKVGDRDAVEIGTDFGDLVFESKVSSEIIESMEKNITFRTVQRQHSQKSKGNNSGSSFLKQNSSTEYKISFDRNASNQTSNSRLDNGKTLAAPPPKNGSKSKHSENIRNTLIKQWRETKFLSERFTKKVKELPDKHLNRRDYDYKDGHTKFLLRQRVQPSIEGKDVVLAYEWKVCPESQMLHSFKHYQKVRVENINKQQILIRYVKSRFNDDQLYIRNKFYRQIEEMNEELGNFIANTIGKQAMVSVEQEGDETRSIDSINIMIDDVNLEDRQDLRGSRMLQKRNSFSNFGGSTANFKSSSS